MWCNMCNLTKKNIIYESHLLLLQDARLLHLYNLEYKCTTMQTSDMVLFPKIEA